MTDVWPETTLGECCSFIATKVDPGTVDSQTLYIGLEHIEPGEARLVRGGTAGQVSSLVSRFMAGDTLFGRLRPYLRKVALADVEGVCSPEVLVLRAKQGVLIPGYLHLLASSPAAIDHAVALSAGSRMPRTSAADLASLKVVVPSLAIQRRIVDLVAAVDNHLANLCSQRDCATVLARSVFRLGSSSAVGTVPLGDVVDVRQGRSLPTAVQGSSEGGVPWFKIADMGEEANAYGYWAGATSLDEETIAELNGQVLPVGSVVFPRVGAAVLTERKRIIERPAAVDENHLVLGRVSELMR